MPDSILNKFYSFTFIGLMSILLLTACGLSGERGGTNGQTANNQNGSSGNGNSEEDDLFVIKETIGIRVERINGEIDKVNTTQISIVSLSDAFREIGSSSAPAYRVEKRQIGGYEIQFSNVYEEKANQVVKVVFNNTNANREILYAPLYSLATNTESITVNAKSHYVLKKLFDAIENTSQLNQLLCSSNTTICENQGLAKANIIKQLNDAVATYTLDIPSSSTVTAALNLLDQQFDLRTLVESSINEITRTQSPFAKGTRRSYDPISNAGPYSQYYHTVFFGLAFSDIKPDDENRSVSISSMSSTIADSSTTEENGNKASPYPGFSQSTTLYDLRRDIINSNIPFDRTSLKIAENNSLTLSDNEDTNFLTSSKRNDTHLSTQGYLVHERSFLQTTPSGVNITNPIGWEFNPYLTLSHQTNDFEPPLLLEDRNEEPDYGSAPTWLSSSNYSKAASYIISGTKKPYNRVEQLEDMHLFSWEVHGLETNKDPGFSVSSMSGKEYGAISYSLKLDDTNSSKAMQLIAETAKWNISSGQNSGTVTLSQPSSHYKTLSLSRDSNHFTNGVRTEINLLESSKTISRQTSDNSDLPYHGLISLSNPGPDQPLGHSTANGSYMALAFNTKQKSDPFDRGQGIILATQLISNDYVFSNEKYLIQGNSMEMNSDKNIIHQLNGSSIEIESVSNIPGNDCLANISVKRSSVEHTLGSLENTLSSPIASSNDATFSQTCSIDGSELYIEFSDIFNEALILRGFITQKNDASSNSPGNIINLVWQQSNQLGLIFAHKELELSPTFD